MAFALLLGAIVILVIELFVPSFGMLFLLASVCLVGSIIVAFMCGPAWGWGFLAGETLLACILPWVFIKLWKWSPIGRRMLLPAPIPHDAAEDNGTHGSARADGGGNHRHPLLGQVGRTLTPLRPAGMSEFSGQRVDTVAEGVMIEKGALVRVIEAQGNRVVVQKIAEDEE
jgi:membrane-bound serine protease (ClpP class)